MQLLLAIGLLIFSYLAGSTPFGLIIVRLKSGKDIRQIESGRTGEPTPCALPAAWPVASTAVLDFLKGAVGVWLAQWLMPDAFLLHGLAAIAAVVGHNYSVFLAERNEKGRLRLRAGPAAPPRRAGLLACGRRALCLLSPWD